MVEQTSVTVPETFDGWAVLHETFQVNWSKWKEKADSEKKEMLIEAQNYLTKIKQPKEGDSACFSMLGHKGDLLFLHFRKTFDDLNEVELGFRQLKLHEVLTETMSYVSVVELGLYEMTLKLHEKLSGQGLSPDSDEWKAKWEKEMQVQYDRVKARLYPKIPGDRYLCFYPMNKKRGESVNWYQAPMQERQRMMRDHGMVGRKYAGRVTQIISGSIGFDDWEWGVDLFAKDPLVFKKLIYEMRFDEASALYAEFGPFYIGLQFAPADLGHFFSGACP